MASPEFNPYRQWLGLPTNARPTFYQLLGLQAFEASPAVIQAAAHQRLSAVRPHCHGPHAEAAERIVRELGAARQCLLSPHDKAQYDDALRAFQAAVEQGEPAHRPPKRRKVPVLPPIVLPEPAVAARPATAVPASSTCHRPPTPRARPAQLPSGATSNVADVRRLPWRTFAAAVVLTSGLLVVVWGMLKQLQSPLELASRSAGDAATSSSSIEEPPLEFSTLPVGGPATPYRPLDLPSAAPAVEAKVASANSLTLPPLDGTALPYVDPDVLAGHQQPVAGVAFTADGQRVVSASWDGNVRIWDFAIRKQVGEFNTGGRLRCLAVAARRALAATGGSEPVRLWDLNSLWTATTYPAVGAGIRSVAFTADGDHLAWGTGDGRLSFRRVDDDKELVRFGDGQSKPIAAIQFFSDRRHVVFSLGNSIRILRAGESKTLKLDSHQQQVTGLDLAPGGRQLASCSWDNTIRIWSLKTGQTVRLLKHTNSVHAIAYSPDGKQLLSASGGHFTAPERFIEGVDNSVRLWNVADGRELLRFKSHDEPVLCAAFSPDGRWAISGGMDRMVRVWELKPSLNP